MSLDIEDLYQREYGELCTFFRKRLSDAEPDAVAADMASTVFLRAWEKRDRYRPYAYAGPKSWLYTIARNLLIDHYRHTEGGRVRMVRLGCINPFGEDAGSDDHVETLHAQITINKALETYQTGNSHHPPDKHLAVIQERFFEGGTDAEIGQRLGMTTMVVKKVRQRAMANLKKMVGEVA